jgi:hypothetical protein
MSIGVIVPPVAVQFTVISTVSPAADKPTTVKSVVRSGKRLSVAGESSNRATVVEGSAIRAEGSTSHEVSRTTTMTPDGQSLASR